MIKKEGESLSHIALRGLIPRGNNNKEGKENRVKRKCVGSVFVATSSLSLNFRFKNAMRAHSNERDHFFDNISEQLKCRCVCVLAGMIRLIREKFTEVLGLKCLQTTWYFWGTVRAVKYKLHWVYAARWVTIVLWKLCEKLAVRVLSFQCSN